MMLSMIPFAVFAATPTTLYLVPNANWKKDNARFAAYFFGNGEKWVSMTKVSGETDLYSVDVPSGYPSVIFCRMNGGTTANNWDNKWNQTGDLTVPTNGNNRFTVPSGSWDGATTTWDTYNPTYSVTFKGTNVTSNGTNTATKGTNYTATLTSAQGYELPQTVTVTVGGSTINTHSFKDGMLTIPGSSITGNIVITAKGERGECKVTFNGTNVTSDGAAKASKLEEYKATLKAEKGYELPQTVSVMVDGKKVDCNYENGVLTIPAASVTGDIVITAEGVVAWYDVAFSGSNITMAGGEKAYKNEDYQATLTPAQGYFLPDAVTVTVGGNAVAHTFKDGKLTIPGSSINGAVQITAQGKVQDITMYLTNNQNWQTVNAYAWTEGNMEQLGGWPGKAMTFVGINDMSQGIYSIVVPSNITGLIFNNGTEQTVDITTGFGDRAAFYLSNKDSGNWSVGTWDYVAPANYYVAGSAGLCGSNWDAGDPANILTYNPSTGKCEKTFLNVPAGTYELKVTNGTWDQCWPENNRVLNLDAPSHVTVSFVVSEKKVEIWTESLVVEPSYYVAGTKALCGAQWDVANANNKMTLNADGLYEITYNSVPIGKHAFKVTKGSWEDTSWGGSGVDGNYETTLTAISDVTITFDPATGAITVAVDPTGEEPVALGNVTIHFRNTGMWGTVKGYAWDLATGELYTEAWPGETLGETKDTVNWYTMTFENLEAYSGLGVIFDNGGDKQTADIAIAKAGTYWYDGGLYSVAPATWPNGKVETVDYEVTLHLANTKNWSNADLYTWTEAGALPTGGWPGTAAGLDANGFYTLTFTYSAPADQGLSFIFSGGGQTVDLNLDKDAFDDQHKIERWIVLKDQDGEGKFYADILDNPNSIAISPLVDGTSVTFQYMDGYAEAVYVAGTMNDWAHVAMEKNNSGVWSLTMENVPYGIQRYKFIVKYAGDAEEYWNLDPSNGWTYTEKDQKVNSAFLISNPELDTNTVKINVHYAPPSKEWNLCAWGATGLKDQYDFVDGVTTITLDGRANQSVAFKIRKSVDGNAWAEQSGEIKVNLGNIVSGTIDVWVNSDFSTFQALNADVVTANKVTSVELDYEHNRIVIHTTKMVEEALTAFQLLNVNAPDDDIAITSYTTSGSTYTLTLNKDLDLVNLYNYKIRFLEQNEKYAKKDYTIGITNVYATERFDKEFTYDGDDLGATWTKERTMFVLWAPTAAAVKVNLYKSGTKDVSSEDDFSVAMKKDEKGVWRATVDEDWNGWYYTYSVTRDGETIEAVDPYARTTGVNGNRGMVIDLDSTDPKDKDGWNEITNKPDSYTDAIIYELHVRDFSIDDSSGMTNKGKFLALTEEGTTVNGVAGGTSTGLDYLTDLGITHLHLLPIYDYASVDETTCNTFNWGYDPQNYNVPEGSYSTNPYNGETRVRELKETVDTLHENEIGVIMDVVYNHVYNAGTFCMNQIVPGYFSRPNSNTSGCGNDTASEREMVQKYIVDSVVYWATEYHLDGFRFDLVGLLDTETINMIVTEVHKIRPDIIFYGEGWDMDSTNREPGTDMAKQGNADKTPGFGYFSDNMRNALAGDNGKSLGYVSGDLSKTGDIASNFLKTWWTSNPEQIIQYASCHDNYTLIDKMVVSSGNSITKTDLMKMNNLAAAIYMTSVGVPFIHAGEEMLREKLDSTSHTGRCENSYNAPDAVNKIRWDNLDKSFYDSNVTYADNVEYYKGLIAFRKAHEALRVDNADDVAKYVYKWNVDEANGVIAYLYTGSALNDVSSSIMVIFNAGKGEQTVSLPGGTIWNVCIDGENAGTEVLRTASGSVTVDGISAMVLVAACTDQHNEMEPVIENEVVASCAGDGCYDSVVYCASCGVEVSRVTTIVPAHSYENGQCTVCDDYQAEIESVTPEIKGGQGLNFHFPAAKVESAAYAKITHVYADNKAPGVVTIDREDWELDGIFYTIRYNNIAAKEMQDRITVDFYAADGTILNVQGEFSYTYMDQVIRTLESTPYDAERTMYVDLLNYGIAAQEYFGYNTDNLTHAKLEEYQHYATATVSGSNTIKSKNGYSGTCAELSDQILIKFAFKKSVVGTVKNIQNVHAIITHGDGTETRLEGADFIDYSSGYWCIELPLDSYADLGKDVNVSIYKNTDVNHENPVTYVTDSLTSYAWRMYTGAKTHVLYECMLKLAASAAALENAEE